MLDPTDERFRPPPGTHDVALFPRFGEIGTPLVLLRPVLRVNERWVPGRPRPGDRYHAETVIFVRKSLLRWYGEAPVLYRSPARNAVAFARGDDGKAFLYKRRAPLPGWWAIKAFSDTMLPLPSLDTAVYDIEFHERYFIFRWPRFLYRGPLDREDRHATVGRQLRESELIEAQFEPLGRRFKPHPFFISEQPLDTVRPPAVGRRIRRKPRADRSHPDAPQGSV